MLAICWLYCSDCWVVWLDSCGESGIRSCSYFLIVRCDGPISVLKASFEGFKYYENIRILVSTKKYMVGSRVSKNVKMSSG